ncbi:MAG: DUF47 family protein [Actinomycetaceae bacterium]|nr:DUF47 family protein [Actinomycetaceae bacterium]
MHFRPNDNDASFFSLLTQSAQNLIEGTAYLAQILQANEEQREGLRHELHAVENASDEITHQFMSKVNQTFVTPLDRNDLTELCSNLDTCMDRTDEAGNLIVIYKVGQLPSGVAKQVDILTSCAQLTAEATPGLKTLQNLRDYWVEINRLENQGDQIYMNTLMKIFETVTDPILLIKYKDIIESLEKAIDSYETLATLIETIAIKES